MVDDLKNYRWISEMCVARGEELVRYMVLGDDDRAEKLRRSIVSEVQVLSARREKVIRALDKIEDERQRLILNLRYLNGMKWIEIRQRMGYSNRYLFQLHDAALKNFEMLYEG